MHEQHRQRLRERFASTGLEGFADHEALELLLTYAIPRQDVNPLAHRLLTRFGSLTDVFTADMAALCTVEGVGPVSATLIVLLGQLLRRLDLAQIHREAESEQLKVPLDSIRYLYTLLSGRQNETVCALLVDKNNQLIKHILLPGGGLTRTDVSPRQVAELALQHHAYGLILGHNHPSGDPTPSEDDAALTHDIQQALVMLDVAFQDHIVVGNGWVFSFRTGNFRQMPSHRQIAAEQADKVVPLPRMAPSSILPARQAAEHLPGTSSLQDILSRAGKLKTPDHDPKA